MELRSLDAVLPQQALITGQIQDDLTGWPTLNPPTVELYYQTGEEQPARRFPLTARLAPGGLFVFAGDPTTAFPQPPPGETLDLRLLASAPGYQPLAIDFSLSAADLTLTEQPRQIDGREVSILLLVAPLRQQLMALSPQPVHLSGCVVNADNRGEPIANAEILVTEPESRGPVESNDDGFFTLQNMPVAQQITVRVAKSPAFKQLTETITLDYRQSVNQRTFALIPK